MSDLTQAPETPTEGQPSAAPVATGATEQAPAAATGQAEVQRDAGAGQAESTQAQDSFFDPSKLPDELKGAYKQMQAAYTRKTQEIAAQRQKVEAYDAFTRDPIGSMQQLASQYGMHLTRAEAKQALQNQGQDGGEDWQPKTWEDVFAKAEERAEARILAKLGPVVQNVQKMQASSIEQQLNTIDPAWKIYEDDMRRNLQAHPTLVGDVQMLYRLSVPEEVYTSRAVQSALAKLQSKANQAQVGTKTESPRSMPALKEASSFQEAVQVAKQMLAQKGR